MFPRKYIYTIYFFFLFVCLAYSSPLFHTQVHSLPFFMSLNNVFLIGSLRNFIKSVDAPNHIGSIQKGHKKQKKKKKNPQTPKVTQ